MATANQSSLNYFFGRYSDNGELAAIKAQLDQTSKPSELIDIYHETIPVIEKIIWTDVPDDSAVENYQRVFQELESLIQECNTTHRDDRHKFYIVIPVADRPIHLQQCLGSLLDLCKIYQYGGKINHQYQKVALIVADDSEKAACIEQHKKICAQFSSDGLHAEYFGIDEQIQQIKKLGEGASDLQNILGHFALQQDAACFSHKGAAITRNITYLRLNEIANNTTEKIIFYFIDSDQEFRIKIATDNGQKDIYAINYFYYLNEIFNHDKISVLTGKVVGDPPVSPAVMAGNFQNDVIDFLQQIAGDAPGANCHFHGRTQTSDDAAYHDMADLFGFKKSTQAFQYTCTLHGEHNHLDCFNDFADKLNHFFDGEHPTRVTYFDYSGPLTDTIPARTIYTGNYAFKPECLRYFISFATLKLRMAGPVLGRIIKSEIGGQFVSANLPMLHKRTTDETGESEFRPGVNREQEIIDLSDEFERQFFGDVMLFTVEKLAQRDGTNKLLNQHTIETTLVEIEQQLHRLYESKHQQIMEKLEILKTVFNDQRCWWNNSPDNTQASEKIQRFINNINHNFGADSQGYSLINSETNQRKRHDEILQAIMNYQQDRARWEALLP